MTASRWALGLALVTAGASASGQVRHRRPLTSAPDIRYGFDNNGGSSGCRDYNCGARCYNGHSGTDFPVGIGTPVLATADGTVSATNNGCANYGGLGSTCGGRCGNYVQIRHADGAYTIFCHMQLNSLAVSRGQRVRCGQQIGRSASSGNSSGPHLHVGYRRTSASIDSFRGRCTSSPGMWNDQNSYPNAPGAACACVPSTEVCDGRDDDCDGRTDEGITRACYGGPTGTQGRGICRGGTQTCARGAWGTCAGQVVPRAETCNMMDDDCDGRADDGVCVVDAGRPDAGRDAVVADARTDASDVVDVATDLGDEASVEGDASVDDVSDASVEDDAGEPEDVIEFEDLGAEEDAGDVSPDIPVDEDGGCGCRAAGSGSDGSRALGLLAVLGAAMVVRRRRRR